MMGSILQIEGEFQLSKVEFWKMRLNGNLKHSDKPLLASFIFATPPAAKYLSQFIDSYISCVNQIPVELLGKTIAAFCLS